MWRKDKTYRLCAEAAEQHPNWRFLKGEGSFVNKKHKWLTLKILPDFRFWPQGTKHQVKMAISMPMFEKKVLTPLYKHKNYCDRKRLTFVEPLNRTNNPFKYEERFFYNEGDIPTEQDVLAEMSRWIVAAEHYFEDEWDTTNETSIFNSANKKWDETFLLSDGANLCALAASLGKFDFVEQHFTEEIVKKLGFVGENFKNMLPELKQKWNETGSAY